MARGFQSWIWWGERIWRTLSSQFLKDIGADQFGVEKPKDLPPNFLRGIRAKKYLIGDKPEISGDAFMPQLIENRFGGAAWESSINHEDDSSALAKTLSDDNGKYGAARVDRSSVIQTINGTQRIGIAVHVERQKTKTNKYHGNVVFAVTLSKKEIKFVADALAINATFIPPE